MSDADSLIKARYAITILKTARASDRATAIKLIEGLALDFPAPETSDDVVEVHHKAVMKFYELAEALRAGQEIGLWIPAEQAAKRWLDLLESHRGGSAS
jgi:hypothetical protein